MIIKLFRRSTNFRDEQTFRIRTYAYAYTNTIYMRTSSYRRTLFLENNYI